MYRIIRISILVLMQFILLPLTLFAMEVPDDAIFLDTVKFQIAAKRWVTTKSSLLTVNINATLGNEELVKAREEIMRQLTKIAPGQWHIIKFERAQDSSGLDTLNVQAQVRAEQSLLNDAYKNAKAISKPGAKYEIASMEFKPDLQEIQAVKNSLREILYNEVQKELERINKIYTTQAYTLSKMEFIEEPSIQAQPRLYKGREMMAAQVDSSAPAPEISLENELVMSAMVEIASNRNIVVKND